MSTLDRNANSPKRLLRNAQREKNGGIMGTLKFLAAGGLKLVSGTLSIKLDPANSILSLSSAGLLSATQVPTGVITFFAATSAPTGWLLCDGSAVSRTTFAALFALLGTGFGPGDGSTTFNVPDLRSRMPLGTGTGTGLAARTLAQTGGEENHVLTVSEMPSHNHSYQIAQASSPSVQSGVTASVLVSLAGSTTGNQGSGVAHNNMPPFLVLTGIIKT